MILDRIPRATWAVVGVMVLAYTLPGPLPTGSVVLGVAGGAAIAVHAIGIVLVHRSDRIINIAQVQLGVAGAALFGRLVEHRTFLVGIAEVCPSCVPLPSDLSQAAARAGETPLGELSRTEISALGAQGWLVGANTLLALLVGLAFSLVCGAVVYFGIIRRFRTAPRLVVTVLTIGVAQTLAWVGGLVPGMIGTRFGSSPVRVTLSILPDLTVSGTTLAGPQVARVALAVIGAAVVATLLRRTDLGIALRGIADNADRSSTLGVNVSMVVGSVWLMAAALSFGAAVLDLAAVGLSPGQASLDGLTRVLAACVVGGFAHLPLTVVGALALGILDQASLVAYSTVAITDALLVVVVLATLRLQRVERERVDADLGTGYVSAREVRPIPAELARVPTVRRTMSRLTGAAALAVLALPWLLSSSQVNLATNAAISGIVGLSLLVLTGWAGQVSLGQFALVAVGAWATAASGLIYPFSLVASVLAGAAVSLAIGYPALRHRGLNLAVTTLTFAVAVPGILLSPRYWGSALPDVVARPLFLGIDLDDERAMYYFVILHVVAATVALVGIRRSRAGRVLLAVRENAAAAESYGIDPRRTKLTAFVLSGAIAGGAGTLFAYSQFGVNGSSFGIGESVLVFLMAVIGGLGSVAGPLLGATYLGVVSVFDNPLLALAATGVGTVVVMLLAPGGLVEVVTTVRDAWLRRVAERHRIAVPSLFADRRADDIDDRAAIAPLPTSTEVPRYRVPGDWSRP